jgi:thiol-disulfide isomerase/thioredoxin
MPELRGATAWINSPALQPADLKGKVVLVDFWTYSCINCLRTLPAMRAWYERYKDQGLVIVGVHSPEFAFEGEPAKVERAVKRFGLQYPVAVDANHSIWNAFHNQYWPAHYLVDASGRIRYQHFGENDEAEEEHEIEALLAERNGHPTQARAGIHMSGSAIEQPADFGQVGSPETYIGSSRAERFASTGADSTPGEIERFGSHLYAAPNHLRLNQWALTGHWTDHGQSATLDSRPGSILFRFHARDLHLVLGPGRSKKPLRFQVLIDGHAPDAAHGADTDANGYGTVTEERLYQLLRQPGQVQDHTFEIRFLDGGVEAFSFTFG